MAEKGKIAGEAMAEKQGKSSMNQADIEKLKGIVPPLLRWYTENKRTLPWREAPSPYRVWISEIMLQQTRVEAGKGYFTRFIEALPDVEALANAEDGLLMKLWEGLGYYNRARNLKKAAGIVVEQYSRKLPETYEGLLGLPGIGPYTAGAIASIAYGIAVPAVDGNVLRVVSRLLERRSDISKASVKKGMEEELKAAMPQDRPGDFNQALMELGAVICLPNGAPKCGECPVSEWCSAKSSGVQNELPVKKTKKGRRIEEKTVIILLDKNGRMALNRRPAKGLLAGLWELPSFDGRLNQGQVKGLLAEKGILCRDIHPIGPAKHVFSHVEWDMEGYAMKMQEEWDMPNPLGETNIRQCNASLAAEGPASYGELTINNKREAEAGGTCNFQPEKLVFVSGEELADIYALPSAYKGFAEFFPK